MVIRKYTEDDLYAVDEMFTEHGWPKYSAGLRSTTGIVYDDGIIKGAGFLYETNSPVALIDMFVVKKSLLKNERETVINLILDKLIDIAKSLDYSVIWAHPDYKKSISRLKDLGFYEIKQGCYMLELKS